MPNDEERRTEFKAIAQALDELRRRAGRVDAGMLAFLLAQAMDEAKRLAPPSEAHSSSN